MSAAIAAAVAAVALAAGGGSTDARLSDPQLVGQRIIVGFEGTQIPASVQRWIADGEVAGVILFDTNFSSAEDAARLLDELQGIERPPEIDEPLLAMVDQEGGLVKRLAGPPDLSAAEMGTAGAGVCHEQGAATGRTLRETGFNVDLAPVLDIGRPGSAIESEGRSFGEAPKRVERCGEAFAAALEAEGVAPTAKHFPGLGAAAINTDEAVQRIDLSASTLRRVDERPYRTYARAGGEDRLVMLSSAIYSAFGDRPAALTRALATDELRGRLGFRGVSITDALQTATTDALGGPTKFARRAARAGTDVLLFTSPEAAAEAARSLRDQLRRPRSRERFAASAARVLALRSRLATD